MRPVGKAAGVVDLHRPPGRRFIVRYVFLGVLNRKCFHAELYFISKIIDSQKAPALFDNIVVYLDDEMGQTRL